MSKVTTVRLVRTKISQLNNKIDLLVVGGKCNTPQFKKLCGEHRTYFNQYRKMVPLKSNN